MAIDEGSDVAMIHYDTMHEKGIGIPVNKNRAAHYYKMATEKGNNCVLCKYALMLREGDGIQADKKRSC